ncbi:MAG: DNA mismatch repair endonuclease MutL [Bacteroidia bacterium]
MDQLIQLLPEHVANQIAAGEVVQRPASVVKELMENAVDAGADSIQLIIKDGGRTLVRVIDNGCGMNEFDARLCFARHATSKIRKADDLWEIRTMGFRGEAMASIAAVAQVEMTTRIKGEELGTQIHIEGSEVKNLEACACPEGTSISVKNLFYNVPARRNFLKSNPVETRHIIDEFQRVALAFPGIAFSMNNNGQEVYRLPAAGGNFKQRIAGLFGNTWNEKLLAVNEETSVIRISGFIGKPEAARKTRGEQFFFINNRFVKSSYFNHAVSAAFQDLIPADSFPVYFIRFEIDPSHIDVNIHPTKTEVKFEDERSVYAILKSAIRKAIASFSLSPTLDFDNEPAFDIPLPGRKEVKAPEIIVNPDYNPFSQGYSRPATQFSESAFSRMSRARWEDLDDRPQQAPAQQQTAFSDAETESSRPFQLHNRYICKQVKSGMMIIDLKRARERITYEKLIDSFSNHKHRASQQLLFPVQKEFQPGDYTLLNALMPDLYELGFEMNEFGPNTLAIYGIPAALGDAEPEQLLDELLEQFRSDEQNPGINAHEKMAMSFARCSSGTHIHSLSPEAMLATIERLFSCQNPNYTPGGKTIVQLITMDEIRNKFNLNSGKA